MALALVFCPESAIFYLGMMIPLSISSSIGILVPLAFGISASLPTIIVAWFLKKAIDKAETISKKFEHFQQWLNIATGFLFISIAILLLMHD
jgi:cytochrome c biogenesis protein CcdA